MELWEDEKGMETISLPPQNMLIQHSEGNEESGYPVPDSSINTPSFIKHTLKEYINIYKLQHSSNGRL
jgi:hypothetical protein